MSTMSDALRRMFNAVERLFDTRAILQESRYSRSGGDAGLPVTALHAFKIIEPFALHLDRSARLKMIVSQGGVDARGASAHWEFFFDLVSRRAQLVCEWSLSWDEANDHYTSARVDLFVKPFPPVGSPFHQAVREGKLLHRQLISLWERECKRLPDLPRKFRDTDMALADVSQQGLDTTQMEFSLSTGQSPQGDLCWVARTRSAAYYTRFVG